MVDTSNEIAGGGAVPHPCIGRARRLPVRDRADQPAILLEAEQNHTAQVSIQVVLCGHVFKESGRHTSAGLRLCRAVVEDIAGPAGKQ